MASTYTWSLLSGTLPPGLTLATGETDLDSGISGTPTTPGVYNFTVRITNDISSAFDDQAYTITVVQPKLDVAPVTSVNLVEVFDAANTKLLSLPADALTDVTGQPYSDRYLSARAPRIRVDLGAGIRTYEIPQRYSSIFNKVGGKYVWRVTTSPDTVVEVILV